jgi:hypothetical protein
MGFQRLNQLAAGRPACAWCANPSRTNTVFAWREPCRGSELNHFGRLTTHAPDHELPNGAGLQLTLEWPILLDGSIGLELMLVGTLVSTNPLDATMQILRYEFRTKGAGKPVWPRNSAH